ncbi:MAG: RnfABCDGE type electron transport complex subunit B [Xanthomonadaceae bacterium]|nr:RnfABCDGE type electron transport complex subunit B [Xanthomonadaceae bacterium]MDE1886190.1 RnfABCDGE type electron transport complex subunit B [Xanthomonadaceae bacterium]MDE1960402.1 RnfABCDGE type electron transport complex subunit B [Xanthomonadaceae bacterium]MDE2085438.1 RnfABCDGE type electron transport complex subunit B [Xanthomonadaceae bacterium]MDE2257938.1 RnfABCDGE type electron transport complex subunit B [Xanthomonadaceae bacterium]
MTLAARIDALLPQTQCTRCGYPACMDYAQAIANGEAGINQCPPGGAAGIAALADLLEREPLPLNPVHGVEKPREVAFIDEAACIGCTKCIAACPVDAIVGAQKMMHTVIADECSGCELCIAPCPVDCITMVPTPIPASPEKYRARYAIHIRRELRREAERAAELVARKTSVDAGEAVAAALARARAKKKMAVAPAGNAEARTSGTTEKS